MNRYDASLSGYNSKDVLVSPPVIEIQDWNNVRFISSWKANIPDNFINGAPIIYKGSVYLNCTTHISRINLSTKAIEKIYTVNKTIVGSPCIDNDKLYFTASDGYIYAFDIDAGNQIWAYNTGYVFQAYDQPFLTTKYGYIFILGKIINANNGTLVKSFQTNLIVVGDYTLYFLSSEGLTAYHIGPDGIRDTANWHYNNFPGISSMYEGSMIYAYGHIYILDDVCNLFAVRVNEPNLEFKVNHLYFGKPIGRLTAGHGMIFATSRISSYICGIDAYDGSLKWRTKIDIYGGHSFAIHRYASPVVSGGLLFFGPINHEIDESNHSMKSDDYFYAYNPITGEKFLEVNIGHYFYGDRQGYITISDNNLYVSLERAFFSFSFPPLPPPRNLYAIPGENKITLNWDAPLNTMYDTLRFKIYCSEPDGESYYLPRIRYLDVTDAETYTFTDLIHPYYIGQTFYYAVSVEYDIPLPFRGESHLSNIVSAAAYTSTNYLHGRAESYSIAAGQNTNIIASILNSNNQPVPDIPINFEITSGDGVLSSTSGVTDSEGNVTVSLTAGNQTGTNTVKITSGQLPAVNIVVNSYKTPSGSVTGFGLINNSYLTSEASPISYSYNSSNGYEIYYSFDSASGYFSSEYIEKPWLPLPNSDENYEVGQCIIGTLNYLTGNHLHTVTDLTLPSRGISLQFSRTNNSFSEKESPLGYGWTHSYNIYLDFLSNEKIIYNMGDGGQVLYTKQPDGTYRPPVGNYSILYTNTDGTFTIREKTGIKFNFNNLGKIITIIDRNNNTISFTYTNSKLTKIIDTVGRAVNISYNSDSHISQMIDTAGRTTTYDYDQNNNLIQVNGPGGYIGKYTYNDKHLLVERTDSRVAEKKFIKRTFIYDEFRRVISETDGIGNQSTINYDTTNRITTMTNPKGNKTIFKFDAKGRMISLTNADNKTKSFTWDDNNNNTSITDYNGKITNFTFDEYGNQTSITDALGNMTSIVWEHTYNNPVSITDANGNITTHKQDARGNLIETKDVLGNITKNTYDSYGQIISNINANGQTTNNHYDQYGNKIRVVNVLGNENQFTYDILGRLTVIKDALDRTTNNTYDDRDRIIKITYPENSNTINIYDNNNNLITVTDANGHSTNFVYNANNQLIEAKDALSNSTKYEHDSIGNRISITDSNNNITRYFYDNLDQLIKSVDSLNNQTNYTYDAVGNRTSITDANGKTTSYQYDMLNRIIKVIDANGKSTNYEYDKLGNKTGLTDANGNKTVYNYDALKRLVSETDAIGKTIHYEYDAVGNLIKKTDGNGNIINYTYDEINQLKKQTYPNNTESNYEYDVVGNRTKMSNQNVEGTYKYDLMNRLIEINYKYLPAGFAKTVKHSYDAVGNRTSITYPDEKITNYIYNEINKLVKIEDTETGAINYEYNPVGNRIKITYPNNAESNYQYNTNNWLTNIEHRSNTTGTMGYFNYEYDNVGMRKSMTTGGGRTEYIYDNLYQLKSVKHPNNQTQVYTYDAAGNRLTMADSYGTVNYQYNNANELQGSVLVVAEGTAANIPVATQPKFSTSTPVNVFTGVTATKTNKITTTYQYDGNGNMINKTENGKQMQYEYDYENRLVKVTYPDNSYEKYIYSPVGKRLAIERYDAGETIPTDTKYFVYDALRCNNVYEFSTSTTTINRYIYINPGNELVAKISTLSANLLSLSYYHSDALGSVSLVTNNTGSVVNTYNYDPFGTITNSTGKGDAYKFVGTIYGVEDDGQSGLYHMNNRYYDASTGRFVSRDIVRGFVNDPLSLNRYVYCKNNPVMYIDPEGLWSVTAEAYAGEGAGFSFGHDEGGWFASVRVGGGLGASISFDPFGTSPLYKESSDVFSIGGFAEVSYGVGKILGAETSIQAGYGLTTDLNVNEYRMISKPSIKPGIGIDKWGFAAATGFEFSYYSKNSKKKPCE